MEISRERHRHEPTYRTEPLALPHEGENWFSYVRVSTKLQQIERQRGDLDADAAILGFAVEQEFNDEGLSAAYFSVKLRPQFEILAALAESGTIDGRILWVHSVSRIVRNTDEFSRLRMACRKHNVRWYVGQWHQLLDFNVDADMIRLTKAALAAEEEIAEMRDRTLSGERNLVRRGRPRGKPAYGYVRTYDSRTNRPLTQVEHPERAAIVREIARRYAADEKVRIIADDLRERLIPTPIDTERMGRDPSYGPKYDWRPGNLALLVTKPVYAGLREYGGKQVELRGIHSANWPAIIDPDTYQQCLSRQERESGRRGTYHTDLYQLSGAASCDKCGGTIRGFKSRGDELYYRCGPRGCLNLPCEAVDAIVHKHIGNLLAARATVLDAVAVTQTNSLLEMARGRVRALDGERADVMRRYHAGTMPADFVEGRVLEIDRGLRAAQSEVARLVQMLDPVRQILGASLELRDAYAAATMSTRRRIIEMLCTVRLRGVGKGGGGRNPVTSAHVLFGPPEVVAPSPARS